MGKWRATIALMSSAPVADLTPPDVDFLLRRHTWTPIVWTITGMDLTGYTAPVLRWAQSVGATAYEIAGTITVGVGTTDIDVTLDSTTWATMAAAKTVVYELAATSPTGQNVCLTTGRISVEESLQ